jgi:hypothetical protein
MESVTKKALRGRWYGISFLLLLVPVSVVWCLHAGGGVLPHWLLASAWVVSGALGLFCAFAGSGGFSRKPTDTLGSLAMALHVTSVALFLLAEALRGSAP